MSEKNEEMTEEDYEIAIQDMVGTEYKYVMTNGNWFPAIVAAYEKGVAFTCLSLDVKDSSGEDHSRNLDFNGNLCILGLHRIWYDTELDFYKAIFKHLGPIIADGVMINEQTGGNPSCQF